MNDFLAKAKEKISSVTRRVTNSAATSQPPQPGASPSGLTPPAHTGAQPRRGKDLTIRVHQVLEREFEDDLTPPASPASSTTAGGGGGGSSSSQSPSPARGLFCNVSADTTPAKGINGSCSAVMSSHDASVLDLLAQECIDLTQLRRLCWQGCPAEERLACWSLLAGYESPDHRPDARDRKRLEYRNYVFRDYASVDWDRLLGVGTSYSHLSPSSQTVGAACQSASGAVSTSSLTSSSHLSAVVGHEELGTMKQIRKDIPRTSGGVAFLQHPRVMLTLERVLYIWALRHPACGYVQGMNDLLLPFIYVIFASRFCTTRRVPQLIKLTESELQVLLSEDAVSGDEWLQLEADMYWIVSHMLNSLQENYTRDQAGAHGMVRHLEALMASVDPSLVRHLEAMNIAFQQFAFRWMNCLLLRELTVVQSLRLWDTYMAEEDRQLSQLHVYVCAALMTRWSPTFLAEEDYGRLMQLLQSPPTFQFRPRDMDEIISSAFLMQQLYERAHGHVHLKPPALGPK